VIKRVFRMAVAASWLALTVAALSMQPGPQSDRQVKRARPLARPTVEDAHSPAVQNPGARLKEMRSLSQSVPVVDYFGRRSSLAAGSAAAASPGIEICSDGSLWDFQHFDDGQRQIATLGTGNYVHFTSTYWDVIPESLGAIWRYVQYNAYSTSEGLTLGDCGVTISGAGGDPTKAWGGLPHHRRGQ
jgi:hypothetical protein